MTPSAFVAWDFALYAACSVGQHLACQDASLVVWDSAFLVAYFVALPVVACWTACCAAYSGACWVAWVVAFPVACLVVLFVASPVESPAACPAACLVESQEAFPVAVAVAVAAAAVVAAAVQTDVV